MPEVPCYSGLREEVIPIVYRTMKLRDLEAQCTRFGGIEGFYRHYRDTGYTRRQIAKALGLSVWALEKWITKWARAKEDCDGIDTDRETLAS